MGALFFKAGVTLRPSSAGARLIGTLDRLARSRALGLTVTAGADSHPPGDPHTLGEAFDVRIHGIQDVVDIRVLLRAILEDLEGVSRDMEIPGVWYAAATPTWFAQIEDFGAPNEHLHVQLRRGQVFPPEEDRATS